MAVTFTSLKDQFDGSTMATPNVTQLQFVRCGENTTGMFALMALDIGQGMREFLCTQLDLEQLKEMVSGNAPFVEEVEMASRDLMGHMKYPSSFRPEDPTL